MGATSQTSNIFELPSRILVVDFTTKNFELTSSLSHYILYPTPPFLMKENSHTSHPSSPAPQFPSPTNRTVVEQSSPSPLLAAERHPSATRSLSLIL